MIDDNDKNPTTPPQYPDHIGWTLSKAQRLWQQHFITKINALGFDWYTASTGNVTGHLPRNGISQKKLIERIGLTKQAVNQQIDELVKAGILKRTVNKTDKRARIIRYTDEGIKALIEIDKIKLILNQEYQIALGKDDYYKLIKIIDKLTRHYD